MRCFVFAHQRVGVGQQGVHFFGGVYGGTAGTCVTAAGVLFGDGVNENEAGTQANPDCTVSAAGVDENDPADAAADGVHGIDAGAGFFQGQAELFLHFLVHIQRKYTYLNQPTEVLGFIMKGPT